MYIHAHDMYMYVCAENTVMRPVCVEIDGKVNTAWLSGEKREFHCWKYFYNSHVIE